MASESTRKETSGKKTTAKKQNITANKKETKKEGKTTKQVQKGTQKGKTTTEKKTTTKKTTTAKRKAPAEVEKKIVRKESVKSLPLEKEEKVTRKEEKVTKVEQISPRKTDHEHFLIYAFLLSTVLICLHVMGRFTFEIDEVTIGYSVILFSTVYFITNVITKKFDFRKSVFAILISMFALMIFIYLSKFLNGKTLDNYVIFGEVFAYLISQLLNLIIYYYLLVNTELKARWIYLNYVFSLGTYYFISILFATKIIMTEIFWPTVFCSLILSAILAIMYAFYDMFIERGHE